MARWGMSSKVVLLPEELSTRFNGCPMEMIGYWHDDASQEGVDCTRKEGEKLEVLCPTIYEWKVIREIVELLNPFEEATRLLSGINYPTIGFTYPIMYNLRERLETKFNLLETSEASECQNAILEDIIARWDFPQILYLKGSFFDPRFKSLDFINSQETCNQIINQLKEEYEILKQDNTARLPDYNDTNESTTMGNFWKKKNAKITAPIKDEF
ncbi:unnamed protein product [Rhizophagus irregularis]|nr:unnamed protein product [Rhizophagus irregularis]